MAAWPDLGRYLSPLEELPQSNVRRTPMEDGHVKQRETTTRQRTEHPVQVRMSASDYATFKTWYRDTVDHGAASFDWVDPADGVSKTAWIKGGQYSARSRNAGNGGEIEWDLRMTLETWDA